MISLSHESVISLADAAKSLPHRRMGRRPNIATLYRWTQIGVRGVKLESLQVGGSRCTSKEALQRFADALTAQSANGAAAPAPRARAGDVRRAEAVLDKAGI